MPLKPSKAVDVKHRTTQPVLNRDALYDAVVKSKQPGQALKIGLVRENLSKIIVHVASDSGQPVVVGSRGEPSVMCVSYDKYKPLLGRGNRAEKLALLVVDELLPDAPPHIRNPAIAELSRLPMSDIETLWGIESFPQSERQARVIKGQMQHPEALDRLAQRARVTRVLTEAREAGLYEALDDAMSSVIDEAEA